MIHLLWAVHNHQPVGNFDDIFARAFDRAYKPFLEVIQRHPGVRVSIHFTGILLDWLEANRPDYLKAVRALVKKGRVEVLGGGYYEPILPMLTEADRVGQITKLCERVEQLFGERPRGMWLAERVWEPSLVSSIADSGIEYVVLDGSHFKMVGKTDADLDGYFETEDQGRSIKLLPIHDVVRDYIPFRTVEDVVHALRELDHQAHAEGRGRVQVVFGDDGEKFGDWPDTYKTVYEDGWLDRFFSALEAEPDRFAVRPLREGVDQGRSLGLVYLPPASYGEMMVWAQNPENIPRYRAAKEALQHQGRGEDAERFLRGTFWRNFLVKYPESNRLHKQALRLSRILAEVKLPPKAARAAREHVWQAQCNCGYWHGVFGGLYLPHLRFALYRHLIAAQKALDAKALKELPHTFEAVDWNFDGRYEYLLNTRSLLLGFTADGAMDQQWLKRTAINLCDTLTRRKEAYHERVSGGGTAGHKLEDTISAKEEGLSEYLIYDRRVRETFVERLLPPGTSHEAWRRHHVPDGPDFVFGAPRFKARKTALQVAFPAVAALHDGELEMLKTYTVACDGRKIDVEWQLTYHGQGEASWRVAVETLFCLLAGNAPDRYLLWEENGEARRDILASRGVMPGETDVVLADEWLRFKAVVEASGNVETWRDAIETVSQSEGGYERVYQGTVVAPVWDVRLTHGEKAVFGLRVEFSEGEEES